MGIHSECKHVQFMKMENIGMCSGATAGKEGGWLKMVVDSDATTVAAC